MDRFIKSIFILITIFILTACGGGSSNNSTVGGNNTPPLASAETLSITQDNNAVINLQATDAEGDSLTYNISTQPLNGSISISGNVATYTPTSNYSGTDSFDFVANDGEIDSNIATVDITISASSSILGRVTQADGSLVTGAEVNILDAEGTSIGSVTSSLDAEFTIISKVDTSLLLSFSKDGFANQIIPVKTPNGKSFQTSLSVVMIPRGLEQTSSIDSGSTLNGPDGASVTLTPNSFVDESGDSVTGDIQITMTPIDISNEVSVAALPGEFSSIDESTGLASAIVSLGIVEFLFSQNGEPLQLAEGMTTDILIPIYSEKNPATGNKIIVGNMIDLWSLNETTGNWLKEGVGTVVADSNAPMGLAVSATVSHFTWWSINVSNNPATVAVTLNSPGLIQISKLFANTDANIGMRPIQVDIPINGGGSTIYQLALPEGGESCLWVDHYANGQVASTPQQCITVVAGGSYSMTFDAYSSLPLALSHYQRRNVFFINELASPILIRPLSLEQGVTYSITSGVLPSGMSLINVGSNNAEIQGVPTQFGNFNVTVEGVDVDGNISSRNITFNVEALTPPLFNLATITFPQPAGSQFASIGLDGINSGGTATSWTITAGNHPSVSITNRGSLEFSPFLPLLQIEVTATNDAGSDTIIVNTITGDGLPAVGP